VGKTSWWFDTKNDDTILIVGANEDTEVIEVPTTKSYVKDLNDAKPYEQARMLKATHEINYQG
jgi:hypothetical protein